MSKLRTKIGLGILVALSVTVLVHAANQAATGGGDSCATATPIPTLPYNDSGDTSTANNSTVFLSDTCSGGGEISREGPDLIYSITVGAGNSLTFTLTPTTPSYDPVIYILGTCGTGSSCTHIRDVANKGQAETLGPITLAPGTHYVYIDSAFPAEDEAGAGAYTLSVTGTLGTAAVGNKFFTLTPCRLIDTRNAPGATGGPALVAGQARTFPIAGLCGVPVGAKAVSINATVIPTTAGYLTAYPGGPTPLVSLINFKANQIRANNGIVPLAGDGTVAVFNGASGSTHFILDVNGYFQ
jgi:hypothetical protein